MLYIAESERSVPLTVNGDVKFMVGGNAIHVVGNDARIYKLSLKREIAKTRR
jgi:hypothetical protein